MTKPRNPLSSGHEIASGGNAVAGLTARQQQILQLMQQGKVNKEIARELEISLGTVKQHLVAIFKKLNVQNRTMAVARLAEFKDQSGFNAVFAQETLIAMRPCIVLSLKVNGRVPRAVNKLFHTCLAEAAFDSQALFMSREPGDGDLVFGLKRSSAQDVRTAILVADHLFCVMRRYMQEALNFHDADTILTGALVAGLISVSQNRFGGWSGETVGSHVLTWGHELRDGTQAGHLYFDQPVKSVMQAFDLNMNGGVPDQLKLTEIRQLNDWDVDDSPLIGRETELAHIQQLLAGDYRMLILEGENGMGKSRLCREAARLAQQENWPLLYVRVLPTGFLDSANYRYFETWAELLTEQNLADRCLLVIDDAHHLSTENRTAIVTFLNALPESIHVVLSGRQPQSVFLEEVHTIDCRILHLTRLEESSLAKLVDTQGGADQSVVERSRGVPLFAKELMLQEEGVISLALLITVASRIDKFRVDWKLLYCVASHDEPVSEARLATLMKDDAAYIKAAIDRAESIGVLVFQSGLASFRHPLVQDVVRYLFKPNNTASAISGYS